MGMTLAVRIPDSSFAQWSQYRGVLSRQEFVARFPHPFLLLGEGAQKAEPEFFTHHLTQDGVFEEPAVVEEEVIPLVKGPANPYTDRVIIGRTRNCDIVLRTPSVSKVHADLRFPAVDRAELVDRGSTNGTFVRGESVVPGTLVPVATGDVIRFALLPCLFLGPGQLYDRF